MYVSLNLASCRIVLFIINFHCYVYISLIEDFLFLKFSGKMTHASGISVSPELAALFTEARNDTSVKYFKVEIVGAKSLSCTYTAKTTNPDARGISFFYYLLRYRQHRHIRRASDS